MAATNQVNIYCYYGVEQLREVISSGKVRLNFYREKTTATRHSFNVIPVPKYIAIENIFLSIKRLLVLVTIYTRELQHQQGLLPLLE